ncbi:Uncharacterised protein [Mycobacteroides abscessus subsp. abscessus]|uniref:hypothetical protein n=1 Tax=Mycobacteroides abscessus TaxID=36809 RepID=UPI00092918DA|nr:hypothetical protein [Mycobacteroides abscessus]SHY96734.1 Uncharacterised protein [Mycobacteroides abscessus subsp. abscessus]SIH28620.1 Uncharacterised protein [Mycobacteroides abscessus subsp. abscessus]SKN42392.1 Uncharacterised protein [Mycobacteroides abscessus subsp. abscessus]SLB69108.1 Uncharacterised protein [Mycobacteroides abscessus subsp. abscessus]
MAKHKVQVSGSPPRGWITVPLIDGGDPEAVAVFVREPAPPTSRIVVRERTYDWPTVNLEKHAQGDAARLNAKVSRAEYISFKPVSQYGQELEFFEGGILVRGDRLYSAVRTADNRSLVMELLFSSPYDQYDRVKPEFVSFLQTLEVVEDEG